MTGCSECKHWKPDGAEARRATCGLLGTRTDHNDWCDEFAALMPDVTTEKLAAAISAGSKSK